MPDKNRKLIDEFKALGAPAAAPRPRATKVSQFEKDFRNSMAREQAEREQAVKSGLTSWATDIPGFVADLAVDLPYYLGQRVMGRRGDNIRPLGYGERVRAELATALGLQNPPSDEVGMRPPPAYEEITDAISLLNPLAWTIAGDPIGIARAGTKATKSVGKALGKEAGRRINEAMLTGEGMLGSALAPISPMHIIKPTKGGNWLKGSVEQVINPLKVEGGMSPEKIAQQQKSIETARRILGAEAPRATLEQMEREIQQSNRGNAINQWIERNLANYIKNQMATPDDPIRKLAEQGVVHMPPEQMGYGSTQAEGVRQKLGMPRLGQSEAARAWEDAADVSMHPHTIEEMRQGRKIGLPWVENAFEPWMREADPQTKVFRPTDSMHASYLGFDHIVDVLKQDLASGRIRPDQLNKVSMEHAVRRAYEYDQEMAKKMREAQIKATEGMPVHKEYPEGYKWIELTVPKENSKRLSEIDTLLNANRQGGEYGVDWLRGANGEKEYFVTRGTGRNTVYMEKFPTEQDAIARSKELAGQKIDVDALRAERESLTKEAREQALENALKYEGETMGHCVGGYCPDVATGRKRIYSLRDAKGQPHVTIEVQPTQHLDYNKWFQNQPEEIQNRIAQRRIEDKNHDIYEGPEYLAARGELPPTIMQIKGKQNLAPKAEYLPFVQDFVRSGQWSDVRDLQNTGMRATKSVFNDTELARLREAGETDIPHILTGAEIQNLHNLIVPEGKRLKYDAVGNIIGDEAGYAKGGTVKRSGPVSQDAMRMKAWDKQVQHKGMGGWMKGATRTAEEAKRLYDIAKGTRSKAAQEAAGLYHPIGGGIKLSKPIELMQFETVKDPTVKGVQRKIITPEDLQGSIGIPLVGDRAAGGTLLTSVEGIPFRNPLTLEAGPDYMLTHTIPGSPESSIWRSGKGVVSGLQRQVEFARDMGRPIYGVNVVGAPTNVNYNTMVTEAILNQYDPAALTKKAKKEFLKDIRNYTPDPDKPHLKPGSVLTEADLNDVEALRAKMLAEGAGPLRKAFVERMALEPFQKMGFPDVPASRLATTEPLLVDVPTGSAGFTVGTIDPAARALEQTPRGHKTYPVALAGEYFGSLGQPIDYRNIFQEFADKRRAFGKPEGSDWRSFSLSPQFQTFDQEWLDRVMKSAGADKPREWKDGGAVNMAGGGDLIRAGKSLMRMKNRMTAEPFAKPSIIKESGGNWMDEAPERAVAGLKSQRLLEDPDITMLSVRLGHARQLGERSGDWDEYNKLKKRLEEKQTKVEDPLNKWIGTQLARYIRNDLGTPKDPIRGLAEKGTLHFDPEPYRHIYGGELSKRRSAAGYPTTGMAETPLGRAWESQADRSISSQTAENVIAKIRGLGHVPPEWLKKLDPKALVYDANLTYDKLGLNHLIDELKNAISPRGGLPPELMLKPESLSKLSVPQAVERVAKINAWREKQAAEALKAQMEGIPILKEYPEGYQWREVPDVEENERALKFAMDVGCEGGWCTKGETLARQYGGGGNKLFVLHDPKGRAVAQINTFPNEKQYFHDDDAVARFWETHGREPSSRQELLEFDKQYPYINEIKGKFNRPPAPELLPYVQDFVKSGKWSRVNELENAGLYKADPHELGTFVPQDPALRNLPGRRTDDLIKAQQAGLFGENQYLTRQEWEDILRRQIESESGSLPPANDMKEGGAVEHCGCNQDAAQPAKQAGGGAVRKALKAVLPKGQQAILPAAESAANLEKFLADSAVKDRLYHATPKSFSEFIPGGDNPLRSGPAVWMTPNKFEQPAAHNIRVIPDKPGYMYGNQSGKFTPGTNVMPLHSSIKNPLYSSEATWKQDFEKFGGSPWTLEPSNIQSMKSAGFDGIVYRDRHGDIAEVVAFEPTQVKSAIGNRGTYDITDPDINKAKGGRVTNDAMWMAVQDKQLRKKHGN